MASYVQNVYQVVFCPKYRNSCMERETRQQVFAYIGGIIKNMKSIPFIVNGVDDHLHIIMKLHQTVALSKMIQEIKICSHEFIDKNQLFPRFTNWQTGYAAFTYKNEAIEDLVRYVKNQEAHHAKLDFKDEYIGLLNEFDMPYEEKYLFE